jgi:glutaredoxin
VNSRCAEHGVALSPEGTCILCRRADDPNAPPPLTFRAPIVPAVITVGILVLSAAGLYVGIQEGLSSLEGVVAEIERPIEQPPILQPPAQPEVELPPPMPPTPIEEPRDPARDAELAAARQQVNITLYSTSWCGYCRQARAYMDERHIRYTSHDIERDARASARMRQLNPQGGVPTFDIDGRPMVGFNRHALELAIDEAAQRHM